MNHTASNKIGPGEAYLRSIEKPWPDACIQWPLSCNIVNGYGQLVFCGKKMSAHRASALLHHGPPDNPKLEVAHSCGNRRCCNPRHLRWATRAENFADKHAHGTAQIGEASNNAKLTTAQVIAAKSLAKSMSHKQIANLFGVSRPAISMAISGATWKHLREGDTA
jgi:predicted XRE-type DNA-binding protein